MLVLDDGWLVVPEARPGARLTLLCAPYAGGGPSLFRDWPTLLPREVEVWALQLPGRAARLDEPPISDLREIVEAVARRLAPRLDRPYAVFGYSMGALLAFELVRLMERSHRRGPDQLYVAACAAPQLRERKRGICGLPDDEFDAELRDMAGTPAEILDNPELMDLLRPTLRADFQACETYRYLDEKLLACPIEVYGGDADPDVSPAELTRWSELSSSQTRVSLVPGGHFFIHSAPGSVLRMLGAHLRGVLARIDPTPASGETGPRIERADDRAARTDGAS